MITTSDEKWKSDEQRAKLLGMIDVPSRQLFLWIKKDMSAPTFSLILSEVRSFYRLFDFSTCVVSTLVETNSTRFEVTNLDLADMRDIESFDIIPSVESLHLREGNKLKIETLNLPAYPLLRFLKLSYCSSVKDVSCLDGIHSLELYYCQNITDISPLNNNYRVSILGCDSITTYSRSFRSTRYLEIVGFRSDVIVGLDSCCHLKSLSLSSTMGFTGCNINVLMILSIGNATNLTALPPNRLQKVSIIKCRHFNSLDNLDHIRSIHLEGLNHIKTIRGLGPKNQIVTLRDMKQLEDISALKEAQRVTISRCPLLFHLNKLNYLTSVKELHLSEGFNCPPSMSTFLLLLNDLHSFVNLNELELSFHSRLSDTDKELLRFHVLQTLKTVERIALHGKYINIVNEDIYKEFNVNEKVNVMEIGTTKVTLLRKRVASASS